jgi:uncharacterized alkaline shock family protein YloU
MSETAGQRNDSPLLSERGVTTISETVVSSLAGMAAQEVDGVHMGGGASRTAGEVLGSMTGSENRTSGITVEVGRTEVAIDLKMGVEYNKNILQTVEEVRRSITDRIQSMTGLRIKELNATITDITFPEKEARRRLGPVKPPDETDESPEETPAAAPETTEPAEHETTRAETAQVETTEADTTSAPAEVSGAPEEEAIAPVESSDVSEEETAVEERPPGEGEIAEQTAELSTEEQPADETSRVDSETTEVQAPPEPETPEARMRRRAEERARRRRRWTQDS